jgi:uncharacterized protein (DUF952 family)
MIYHIASQADWQTALQNGFYEPPGFTTEHFIHACKEEQVSGVFNRYFKEQKELIVLHIDEKKLIPPHTFVFVAASNDEFPHIFGQLNIDAVTDTTIIDD